MHTHELCIKHLQYKHVPKCFNFMKEHREWYFSCSLLLNLRMLMVFLTSISTLVRSILHKPMKYPPKTFLETKLLKQRYYHCFQYYQYVSIAIFFLPTTLFPLKVFVPCEKYSWYKIAIMIFWKVWKSPTLPSNPKSIVS
jgi:hypothetical protein